MQKNPPNILVVEDELLIAMDVENMVRELGGCVVGPFGRIAQALTAIRDGALDGAVLDVNLGNERVWPIADLLAEKGIPFVFTSGYGPSELAERFRQRTVLSKPVNAATLRAGLAAAGIIPA